MIENENTTENLFNVENTNNEGSNPPLIRQNFSLVIIMQTISLIFVVFSIVTLQFEIDQSFIFVPTFFIFGVFIFGLFFLRNYLLNFKVSANLRKLLFFFCIVTITFLVISFCLNLYRDILMINSDVSIDEIVNFAQVDIVIRILFIIPISYSLFLIGWRLVHSVNDYVGGLKMLGWVFFILGGIALALFIYGIYWDSIIYYIPLFFSLFTFFLFSIFLIVLCVKARKYGGEYGFQRNNNGYEEPSINYLHITLVFIITVGLAFLNDKIGLTINQVKDYATQDEMIDDY